MEFDIYLYGIIALLGLAVGSFLNVIIFRLPRNKKVVFRRSACPQCSNKIPFYDNIPLLSYLILMGKCRKCGHPISAQYPLVEFINAVLYILFLRLDGLSAQLPIHCFLASALIVIFFIDLEFQIIPDKITIPAMAIGLTSSIFIDPPGIVNSIIGFLVGGVTLLAVAYLGEWLFKKEAMGGGDIKMAAMMGAFVGWQKVLLIFLGGAVIGMVVSIFWMALSRKIRTERLIPFGPFLATAAVVVVVYGDQIIKFYTDTMLTG